MRAYDLAKPVLFALPPETVHAAAGRLLRAVQDTPVEALLRRRYATADPRLETTAFGCRFPTPVCVAAGFDKNAAYPRALSALGFGGVEVGGVTAEAQPGNPRPRLFRLPEDRALINRLGFNNDGADAIGARLDRQPAPDVPLGINVGKSKSTPLADAPADYRYTYRQVADAGDYFVVNVSSPNTPGLRSLQDRAALEGIVAELRDAGAAPLLIKLSPDLADPAVEEALSVVEAFDLEGVVATNTTVDRPAELSNPARAERGGLSGAGCEWSGRGLSHCYRLRAPSWPANAGPGGERRICSSVVEVAVPIGTWESPSLSGDVHLGESTDHQAAPEGPSMPVRRWKRPPSSRDKRPKYLPQGLLRGLCQVLIQFPAPGVGSPEREPRWTSKQVVVSTIPVNPTW